MIDKRIKELRISNGLTQKDLAAFLGLTPKMISFYELGQRTPPSDIILKLAEKFNVSTDYLLGNKIDIQKEGITPKRPKELTKLIEQEEYTLNGRIATQEDKDKLAAIIEALYWDAKEKNKRK